MDGEQELLQENYLMCNFALQNVGRQMLLMISVLEATVLSVGT